MFRLGRGTFGNPDRRAEANKEHKLGGMEISEGSEAQAAPCLRI